MKEQTSTIDPGEVEKFSKIASEWWNPRGKFGPLHRINPVRIQYVLDRIQDSGFRIREESATTSLNPESPIPNPLKGLSLLDIGCGGGLISEPMARLGARVTGIDASEKNIAVAKLHAEQGGLEIDYRCVAAEELVGDEKMRRWEDEKKNNPSSPHLLIPSSSHPTYDIVLALEIIEHVADVEAFVAASCALLKPGGLIIYSTLNRTVKSFVLAIAGAEYICGLLPRGTHDWKKFLRPSELCNHLRRDGIEVTEMTGMVMNPLNFEWRLEAKDLSVNYLVAGRKGLE